MCQHNSQNCGGCNQDPCGCKTSTDEVVYRGPNLTCIDVQNCDNVTEIIQNIDTLVCSQELVQIFINNIVNNFEIYQQFTTLVNTSVDCETVLDCIPTTSTTTTVLGELSVYNLTLNSSINSITVESGDFLYTNVLPVGPSSLSTGTHGITTAALIVDLDIVDNKNLELIINDIQVETLTFVSSGLAYFSPVIILPTDKVEIKLIYA